MPWQKGQSGNPGGRSRLQAQADRRLSPRFSPRLAGAWRGRHQARQRRQPSRLLQGHAVIDTKGRER
jgi:hypothetical protein